MLSDKEKHGITDLLKSMDKDDLLSLGQTVTSNIIVPKTDGEAIESIILHTAKPTDLLKRKKIKKELLFKYLHSKKVPIESLSDKKKHIQLVLQIWESADSCDSLQNEFEMESDNSLDSCQSVLISTSNVPAFSSIVSIRNDIDIVPSPVNNELWRGQDESYAQVEEMSNKFVNWYYNLLNSCLDTEQDQIDCRHFWPDASVRVELVSGGGEMEIQQVEQNGSGVARLLVQVVRNFGVKHNPNICPSGVRGRLDPHGLVLILACGTLHNQHSVCGIFEQVFGLVRDPGENNNWKIKKTQARMVSTEVNGQHSLLNCQMPEMLERSFVSS